MEFLAIVIALALIYWVSAVSHVLEKHDLIGAYVASMNRLFGSLEGSMAAVALVVNVIVAAVVVLVIFFVLKAVSFGLLSFLFSIAVLLFCLGSLDFSSIAEHDDLIEIAINRIFSVIFWFALLGPAGAVVYRVAAIMNSGREARIFQQLLDWIPVRLLALAFAIVGHFTQVITGLVQSLLSGYTQNEFLLTNCFDAAYAAEVKPGAEAKLNKTHYLIQLINRSLIVWLVVLALIVLL
jgi:AmpE protein